MGERQEINANLNFLHEGKAFDANGAVTKCFNWNALHEAASSGDVHFKTLLDSNPKLVDALDSQQRSLLHLAAANGHVDIVRILTKVRPQMCLARDRDGLNPLHVAATMGRVEVFDELVKANPLAARARVDRGERETILHLCVKYNQLPFLKLLLGEFRSEEFANSKDDDGNTILHLAVAGRLTEIIKYVLEIRTIDVNAKNARKKTAMDILLPAESRESKREEIIEYFRQCFQCKRGSRKSEGEDSDIEVLLRSYHAATAKETMDPKWLGKKRNALTIVAVLMATIAFQAGVTPPGGVWPDNKDGHRGGEAVMAYNYPNLYRYFLRSNTIGFVASLSTILLLISGVPFRKRIYVWMLVAIMCLTITSMAFTYAFSIAVITPKWEREALSHTIGVAVVVWSSVTAIVLLVHTIRSTTIFLKKWLTKNPNPNPNPKPKPKPKPNSNPV
ncbi:hypothetical protein Vadar_032977 [Vaccinium darrowii]|uniref:Uncharacterized protein n=1 Tax=Vaccinium darrowii TaxID=229202 RepID=A0ACB7XE99_9ERIC|nr:hypothetical protein Vadar_032977 [Vaccinium darrowii]